MTVYRGLIVGLMAVAIPGALSGACSSTCQPDGRQSSGAVHRICVPDPSCYNGDLVIYAHGYVEAREPVGIPEDQLTLPDGTNLPQLINGLGFGFATTSYRRNGLSVLEGVADIADLVSIYRSKVGQPRKVYVVGPSEGGLITAKSIELLPNLYAGGLAACGPIGNWVAQINYLGNFRASLDYFFPQLLPGDATNVPSAVLDNWEAVYLPRLRSAMLNDLNVTAQFLRVAQVPIGLSAANVQDAVSEVGWYQVFGTVDAIQQLRGQPYDNKLRTFTGSNNDSLLNANIKRYTADPVTQFTMRPYETTGQLQRPLVTLHTTGDPIIPYWHETAYRKKVENAGRANLHINIPVFRFGHCQFNAAEVLAGFAILLLKVGVEDLKNVESSLRTDTDRATYRSLLQQHRTAPAGGK